MEINDLMNSTDIIGLGSYPIGLKSGSIRDVFHIHSYNPLTEAKSRIPVVKIFDWNVYKRDQLDFSPVIPTLKEMKSMSWQFIASGATGLTF